MTDRFDEKARELRDKECPHSKQKVRGHTYEAIYCDECVAAALRSVDAQARVSETKQTLRRLDIAFNTVNWTDAATTEEKKVVTVIYEDAALDLKNRIADIERELERALKEESR